MFESVGSADDLDKPIYGAKNIGVVVNLTERQAFHALEKGYLDGDKFGKKWRSTKRRLLNLSRKPAPSSTPKIPLPSVQPDSEAR
jgi:hypothetical protein